MLLLREVARPEILQNTFLKGVDIGEVRAEEEEEEEEVSDGVSSSAINTKAIKRCTFFLQKGPGFGVNLSVCVKKRMCAIGWRFLNILLPLSLPTFSRQEAYLLENSFPLFFQSGKGGGGFYSSSHSFHCHLSLLYPITIFQNHTNPLTSRSQKP